MSDHRTDIVDLQTPGRPRVTLDHARSASKHYWASRQPLYADERGAVAVVDLLDCGDPTHATCGGRRAFFRVDGEQLCDVVDLPRRASK